jgi:hypothetical protein
MSGEGRLPSGGGAVTLCVEESPVVIGALVAAHPVDHSSGLPAFLAFGFVQHPHALLDHLCSSLFLLLLYLEVFIS